MRPFTRRARNAQRPRRTATLLSVALSIQLSIPLSIAIASPGVIAAEPEYHTGPQTRALGLPFSDAVTVDGMVYLSGQIGNLPGTTTLAPGGIEAEARQALDNVEAILAREGIGMERIVKCTVMLADIAEWPAFNAVYVSYFPGNKPARSAFATAGLAFGARVEVECWAAR